MDFKLLKGLSFTSSVYDISSSSLVRPSVFLVINLFVCNCLLVSNFFMCRNFLFKLKYVLLLVAQVAK